MKGFAVLTAIMLLCLGSLARADVFNLGPGLTNLETVTVGDPGNAPDMRYANPGYGSVSYTYNIGKYEVTAAQYTEFLNAKAQADPYGLYNTNMSDNYGCKIQRSGSSGNYTYSVTDDWANRPVNYVGFWDACRFVNWLNNGQGDGDTETGAYTLNGYNGPDGRTIQRNAGAKWFIPSNNEWYKAAYYKGGGTDAGYWDYPTQSDSTPSNDLIDPDPGNNANFFQNDHTIGSPYFSTIVGEFENSESAYGTFDQGGNVWEWNEALMYGYLRSYRGLRGGFFYGYVDYLLGSYLIYDGDPRGTPVNVGFRVAAAVPEPTSLLALLCSLGGVGGAVWRGRTRR